MKRLCSTSLDEYLNQPIWVKTYMSNYLRGVLLGVFVNGDIEVLFDGEDSITTLSSLTHEIVIWA